ncbi:MAG: hypothetical protein ACRDD7_05830 [Peptostreptococcaceae bacterium]
MNYYEVIRFCFIVGLLLGILFIIYKSRFNIILSAHVQNNKVEVYLEIIYLFNIIKIKIPIYSTQKNKKRKKSNDNKKNNNENNKKESIKEKESNKNKKIPKNEFILLYKLVKGIKVKELYSNIKLGNTNIYFTCFIDVFVNIIYANISNIINSDKMYLNIIPNFTQNYIDLKFKIHISPRIEDLYKIIKVLIKIYLKNKVGGNNESSRVNTKSYGNNS